MRGSNWCLAGALTVACGHGPLATSRESGAAGSLRTTAGAIAVGNLEASLEGLEHDLADGHLALARLAELTELHLTRGQFLGRVADYDRAQALAERLVAERGDATSYLARGRARAALHRFPAALRDLDQAARSGADRAAVDGARAAVFQAVGRFEEALEIRARQATARRSISTLGALASAFADAGDLRQADRLFAEALGTYRDASPFPVAWVQFQRGTMWMQAGQLTRARDLLEDAHRRLPAYAAATTHLGEAEAALGRIDRAVELLRHAAEASDDPDSTGQVARVLLQAGRGGEAAPWRRRAEQRFAGLLARHPEAFADHAAEFWLAAGGDPGRALRWARFNLELRPTPRARELEHRCAIASARG